MKLEDLSKDMVVSDADLYWLIAENVSVEVNRFALQYGSVVYFCLGEVVQAYAGKGEYIPSGEVEISIECDDWVMLNQGVEIADGETIDRSYAEGPLAQMIVGHKWEKLRSDGKFSIFEFSGGLVLKCWKTSDSEEDRELYCITMPNGHLVYGMEPSRNIATGSFTKEQAEHWRLRKAE